MFPTDSALASNVSGEWLYSGIADLGWADSLEPEARDLFRQNGFYSSLVRPGFRIISLNTNFCQGENFFLFLDFSDPADQLAWLAEELLKAELAGFNFLLPTKHYPNDYLEVRGFTSWVTILSKAVCRAGPESTERSSTGSREPSQRSSTATLTTTGSSSTTTRRGSPPTPPSWPPAGRPTPTGTQSSESTLWLQIK